MVAVAVLSMAQWAEGAFPGRNGRIAMGASWLGCEQGRIATIKPDGTGFRALTRCGEGAPEWFADGRRLLFTAKAGLSVMAADGSHRRVLPPGVRFEAIDQPSIAPDGRHLTFLGPTSNPDPYAPDARPQVWRVAFDGTHRRAIGEGYSPRWSPNGRRIAFVSVRGLSIMDARTGQHVRLLVPGITSTGSLDWSPDSRRLLFSRLSNFGGLDVVRTDGKGPVRTLLPAPASPYEQLSSAVWSPNGKRIAFARARYESESAEYTIWTATARGTRQNQIRSSGTIDSELTGPPSLSWGPEPVAAGRG